MSTEAKKECVALTWEIENYTLLFKHSTFELEQLTSPLWKMDIRDGSEWFFLEATAYKSTHSIRFELNSINKEWYPDGYKMSLITSAGEVPFEDQFSFSSSLEGFDVDRQKILHNETLTVCCRMWKETLRTGERRIRSILKKANFLWTIKSFSSYSSFSHSFIQEDMFFHFKLEPESSQSKGRAVTVRGLTSGEGVLSFIECAVWFRDGNRQVISKLDDFWCPTTCKRYFEIYSGPEISGLKIHLEFVCSVGTLQEGTCSSDFQQLYKEQIFTDATLSAEGRSFSAHRAILAARSPVFRAMFEQKDTSEALSGAVAIDDVDSDTLDRMLGFLYGDYLRSLSWEEASALYYAADKYGITPLKHKCVHALKSGLTTDNVCDTIVLADRHGEEDLMKSAVDFVCDHQEVVTTAKWEDLEKDNPSLTSKIAINLFLESKRRK